MPDFKVVAIPTTPLSALQDALNVEAGLGYTLVTHFFGSDGSHHVAGGVQPTKTTTQVMKDGIQYKVDVVANRIVCVFYKA